MLLISACQCAQMKHPLQTFHNMVKPPKDTALPGNDKQLSTIDNEVPESLKRIVIRPDTIQCISFISRHYATQRCFISMLLSLTTLLWIDTAFLLNFALTIATVPFDTRIRLLNHLPSSPGPMRLGNSLSRGRFRKFNRILTYRTCS